MRITGLPLLIAIGAAVSLGVAGCASPATLPLASTSAAPAGDAAGITASGVGQITGSPDVLTISIGVQTTAATAVAALARNAAVAGSVQGFLARSGVGPEDLQTTQLSLWPQYGSPNAPVTGYQVSDIITAKLRDLSKAGATIDGAVAAAGNDGRLQGVSFSFSDASGLQAAARKQAVTSARAHAQEMADAAGVKLGTLRSISEVASPVYPYPYGIGSAYAGAPSAAGSTPIQPGTEQLTVNLTATWNVAP